MTRIAINVGSAVVEVDDEGGVVVPMTLWASLGIAAGDCVKFWLEGDGLQVAPVDDDQAVIPERSAGERED